MRKKADLLARDEYAGIVLASRIARMVVGFPSPDAIPQEVRVEKDGIEEWDDIVEIFRKGHVEYQHGWQVRCTTSSIKAEQLKVLLQNLVGAGSDFHGHLGVRCFVEVVGMGELRILRDLTEQLRPGTTGVDTVDLTSWSGSMHAKEKSWLSAVACAIGCSLPGDIARVASLIRRLHVEVLGEEKDIQSEARKVLGLRFVDPENAWNRLRTTLSDNTKPHVRFTRETLAGVFQGLELRSGAQAEQIDLDRFRSLIVRTVNTASRRVETGLELEDGTQLTLSMLVERLQNTCVVQVTGESGAGKSFLMKELALELASQASVLPVMLDMRASRGRLEEWLDDASTPALATRGAFHALLAHPVKKILLVDFIDDASEFERSILPRLMELVAVERLTVVYAARRRLQANLVVHVRLPDLEMKRALLKSYVRTDVWASNQDQLLELLRTPMDVKLAAECFPTLSANPSQYDLFDAFVRIRTAASPNAHKVLQSMAGSLRESARSTLSMSTARRLADACGQGSLLEACLQSAFLEQYSGRIAFSHERFLCFADSQRLLGACDDPHALVEATKSALHPGTAEFVLGALQDVESACQFVAICNDQEVLKKAWDGKVGSIARAAMGCVWSGLRQRLQEEAATLRIVNTPDAVPAAIDQSTFGDVEQAFLTVVGSRVAEGDERLQTQVAELFTIADRRWRSVTSLDRKTTALLHQAYIQFLYVCVTPLGISRIFQAARFRRSIVQVSFRPFSPLFFDESQWTPGVMMLMAELAPWDLRQYGGDRLVKWFNACWETRLYNVQLSAVEALTYFDLATLPSVAREELSDTLVRIWEGHRGIMFGPIEFVYELLVRLGTFENNEAEWLNDARRSIAVVLQDPGDAVAPAIAGRVFDSQFEPHIGTAYSTAVEELPALDRVNLLLCALKDSRRDRISAPDYLLLSLIELDDPRVVDAVRPWAETPIPQTMSLGEGVTCFIVANACIGKWNARIESVICDDEWRVWRCFGNLVQELHRSGASNVSEAWHEFERCDPVAVMEVLADYSRLDHWWTHRTNWPDPVLSNPLVVARMALNALRIIVPPAIDVSSRRRDSLSLVLSLLERYGDEHAISEIRRFVSHQRYGAAAVSALQAIQERLAK